MHHSLPKIAIFLQNHLEKAIENSNDQKTLDNQGRVVECPSHHGVNLMFNVVMEFSRCSSGERGRKVRRVF